MPDPIPEGFRLLHVGPGKTGTTAVQSAFHHNRAAIAEAGVHYAGGGRQPWIAANQALSLSPQVKQVPRDRWEQLLRQIESAREPRTVISSEAFARADETGADAIAEALGRDRTHVVITMRPPADLLASNWWQSVASGGRLNYQGWLERALVDPVDDSAFWFRTRFDIVAARWAAAVGPENVTAISIAGQPRDFVLRTFEALTDLPDGILVPAAGESNASLAHPMSEVVRQFYEIRRQQGLKRSQRVNDIRAGALNLLRRHPELLTGEQPIITPAWAADAASEVAAQMNDRIASLGINVIGDLAPLAKPSKPAPEDAPAPTTVAISDAAALVHAMVRAAQIHEDSAVKRAREQAWTNASKQAPSVDDLGGRELVRLLGRRVKRRITPG